jgi:acyl dehydratase
MALNESFLGRTYPPTRPYEVSREKIREFADAIGDQDPAYRDPAAARALGYPDVIAPPTFAVLVSGTAAQQISFDPELGLDYSKVVHGEQRFHYVRPLRAGDVIHVVVSVESIRAAAGNDLLGIKAEVSTVDGEPIVSVHSLLIARGTAA